MNYTKTPNAILEATPSMSEAELKLTMVLVRKTYGYHVQEVRMTFDDMQSEANLSRTAVNSAVAAVEKRGFFARGRLSMWYVNSSNSLLDEDNYSSNKLPNEDENSSNLLLNETENSSNKLPDYSSNKLPSSLYKEKEEKERGGEEPPFPFQPNPTTPAQESPADKRVTAVLETCQMSADVPRHKSRAELTAAQLRDVSAGYIRDRYGRNPPNGHWNWYQDDWRGKKGEPPTPERIIETIYYTKQETAVSSGQTFDDIINGVDLSDILGGSNGY